MIKIVCVGKIKEKYLKDAIAEYQKRISKYTKLNIIEVKDYDYDDINKVLQEEKEHLTSAQIAKSVKTNPAYIRQLMAVLKNASLISNIQGQANACLTKPADEITMLDIYRAVEGEKPLLHLDIDTNPECGVY